MSRLERDRPDSLGVQEMLRIMDVATTLRLDRELVEEQLNVDELKARLKERMLAASKVTGESVTPEEVDAAIRHYYSGLYDFREPKINPSVALAHAWVRRRQILAGAGVLAFALGLAWWLLLSSEAPLSASGRAHRQVRALSREIARRAEVVKAYSGDAAVGRDLAALVKEGDAFREKDDPAGLATVRDSLATLETKLGETYQVSVVAGTNRKSGFPRAYQDRQPAFYLVVEATTADGKVLKRKIRNDEDGSIKEVSGWAERVPEGVYERLKKDKLDDGVLNEVAFAVKRKGVVDEEVTMPGLDGKPLGRMGQLNQWPQRR